MLAAAVWRPLTTIHCKLKVVHGRCLDFVAFSHQVHGHVKPTLTLYSKSSGCSLCDDAKDVLKNFKDQFTLEEVDITKPENRHWYKLYRYDIPVLHVNGQFLMKHRVDVHLLQQALNSNNKT